MDCYKGCGAPLVGDKCEHCGRVYPEVNDFSLEDLTEIFSRSVGGKLNDIVIEIDEEEEKTEIVAMGVTGVPPRPPPSNVSTYPRSFEDAQSTLGVFTVVSILIGVLFYLIGLLSLGLLVAVFGLGCGIAGAVRQRKHDKEEK